MQRIDTADNTASLPAPETPGTPGYFRADTDPVQTTVSNDWANQVQEELVAPPVAAGITLSKTSNIQLAQAIQSGLLNYALATNTGNAYSVTFNPVPYTSGGVLLANSIFRVKIPATNTNLITVAPTLAINGGSALNIKLLNGLNAVAGSLRSGMIAELLFDGTDLILLNPADVRLIASVSGTQSVAIGTGKYTAGVTSTGSDPYQMYNSTDKRFILPVAGRWRVNVINEVTGLGVPSVLIGEVYVNGVDVARIFEIDIGAVDWNTGGNIILNNLAVNDYIELFLRADSSTYNANIQFSAEYLGY